MKDARVIQLRRRPVTGAAPALLKVPEAAARIRVSERTFYRWLKTKRPPPHVWLGPDRDILRVPVDALDEWWRGQMVSG